MKDTPMDLSSIINAQCSNLRLVAGGTLILYFNPDNPDSRHNTLWIDCAWRLRKHKSVLIGSLDEPNSILAAIQQIVGHTVTDIDFVDDTWDARIMFNCDMWIETFGYSVVDGHWEYRRNDGYRCGVGPQFELYEKYDSKEVTE